MKITYTSPNLSHHYPYAIAMNNQGVLNFFVTGVSRFNTNGKNINLTNKLKRYDFFQNIFLLSRYLKLNNTIQSKLANISQNFLDKASFKYAKDSDFFIYYRGCGSNTTKKLRTHNKNVISILEEVNTHVLFQNKILQEECKRIGIDSSSETKRFDRHLRAYELADYILCPSNFVANSFLSMGFPNKKLIVNNFGRTFKTQPFIHEKNEEEFKLLYVGQLHYRKGIRYAIEAFKKIKYKKKKFYLVGPITGPTGIDLNSLPKDIFYLGVLKGSQLREIYNSVSAFVLPSLEEGLALVQGEALNASLPLITTKNTGGEDLIKNGLEGFIVEPGSSEELHNCFVKLTEDIELRRKMRIAAYKNSLKNSGWEKSVKNLLNKLPNIEE